MQKSGKSYRLASLKDKRGQPMFRENIAHLQRDLFGLFQSMPARLQAQAEKSEERNFYESLFCKINEQIFSVLYSDEPSRPNKGVNTMAAALVLREKRHWTYAELFNNVQFNLLTRLALGLNDLESMPFCEATLFNFQNRLKDHYFQTGINLFESAFDSLTKKQLSRLKLKTNIARTDSFMINSNIRQYGRLQLLLEVILRLYHKLSESGQTLFRQEYEKYTEQSSELYLYNLKGSDLPHEFEKVTEMYYWLHSHPDKSYSDIREYRVFQRVYEEHFKLNGSDKLELIPSAEMKSDSLQSPDDEDATYRSKRGEDYHGYSGNVVETCHPDNPVDLIVDVTTRPNNVDDSVILHERLDDLTKKLPDLEEFHFDGAYGSEANDEVFEEKGITPVQTAVRGQEAAVEMEIEETGSEEFQVTCPGSQTVKSEPTKTRYKALFDKKICSSCPYSSCCPTIEQKGCRTFYFSRQDYLRKSRHRQILKLPPERSRLRSNVEATIFEFVQGTRSHKLKVRGIFKASLFVFSKAIGINFGRIFRNMKSESARNGCFSFFRYAKTLFKAFWDCFGVVSGFSNTILALRRNKEIPLYPCKKSSC